MAGKIPSAFVPLDVNYAHDRAIRQAGYQAELLFVRGLAYARKMFQVTGGLIPDYDLDIVAAGIPNAKKHAASLVRERLWIASKGGWHIRSFGKWNPEIDRSAQRTGGALGNHNRWHSDGNWSPDCEFCGGTPIDDLGIGSESVTDRPTDPNRTSVERSVAIATESVGDRFGSQRERREGEGERSDGSPSSSSVTSVTRGASLRAVPGSGDAR